MERAVKRAREAGPVAALFLETGELGIPPFIEGPVARGAHAAEGRPAAPALAGRVRRFPSAMPRGAVPGGIPPTAAGVSQVLHPLLQEAVEVAGIIAAPLPDLEADDRKANGPEEDEA